MKVIIVGAGIGGLTTALFLHQRGMFCEIYEQASQVREVGVGINTLPPAIKELEGLGLLPALDATGIRTRELIYLNRLGQEVWREPPGLDAGQPVPQFCIHRGRRQSRLRHPARARLRQGLRQSLSRSRPRSFRCRRTPSSGRSAARAPARWLPR